MPCLRLAAVLIIGAALTGLAATPAALAQAATSSAPESAPKSESAPAPQTAPASAPETTAPAGPSPLRPDDAFGEVVTLPARTILYVTGHSNWDSAFDTLTQAYRSLGRYLETQGIKPDGPAMTIYTKTDDIGFGFRAAQPVAAAPKEPPKDDIAAGEAPSGKALKFVHRGSYAALDSTYEAITNYLDEKQLDAKDQFIEEYETDILKTSPDNLVVNIYVPVK